MESQRLREPWKTLATKISRRRALVAAAGGAGASTSAPLFNRQALPTAGAVPDPVTEAGHRITAAIEHQQIPLPRVRLPVETKGEGPGQ
jgi:hypothetical protein